MREEAEEGIAALRVESDAKTVAHTVAMQAVQMENSQLRTRMLELEAALEKQGGVLVASQADHQRESTIRLVAEQQVADLTQRLAENEAHRQSLEEKHLHTRQTLEHYRQSVREQREADIRRHEQQVQQIQAELRLAQQTIAIKQDDITRLNQEGAKLVAELSHAKQDLYEQLTRGRKLEEKIDALQSLHTHAADTERQLAAKIAEAELLAEQLAAANGQITPVKSHVRELELSLAQANARLQAQEQIGEQLRAYLDKIAVTSTVHAAGK